MVTMATKSPIVTMNHGRETGGERLIRTPEAVTPARLTRRGRMVVTGVSALLIGALSVGFATAAQATRDRVGFAGPVPHQGDGATWADPVVPGGDARPERRHPVDHPADTAVELDERRRVSPGEVLWVPRE